MCCIKDKNYDFVFYSAHCTKGKTVELFIHTLYNTRWKERKSSMKTVQIPKELRDEYNQWKKDLLMADDAKRNDERYQELYKVIQLSQDIFGTDNVQFDDPEVKFKRHVINITSEKEIMLEDEDCKAFGEILRLVDYVNFDHTADEKTNRIYYGVENVYSCEE